MIVLSIKSGDSFPAQVHSRQRLLTHCVCPVNWSTIPRLTPSTNEPSTKRTWTCTGNRWLAIFLRSGNVCPGRIASRSTAFCSQLPIHWPCCWITWIINGWCAIGTRRKCDNLKWALAHYLHKTRPRRWMTPSFSCVGGLTKMLLPRKNNWQQHGLGSMEVICTPVAANETWHNRYYCIIMVRRGVCAEEAATRNFLKRWATLRTGRVYKNCTEPFPN